MGVLVRLTLAGVERLERVAGPRVALRAVLRVLDRTARDEGRPQLVLRGLTLAGELQDDEARRMLLGAWRTEPRASRRDVARLAATWLRRGQRTEALELARAERARRPNDGESAYVEGRVAETIWRETAGEPALEARQAAHEAYERALRLGPEAVRRAARDRLLAVTGPGLDVGHRAAWLGSEALSVDGLAPAATLRAAQAALGHPSRHRRVAPQDRLEDLARVGGDDGRRAIRLAAAHLEAWATTLTAIEADRVLAILALYPDPVGRQVAVARADALLGAAKTDEAAIGAAHADPVAERFLSLLPAAGEPVAQPPGGAFDAREVMGRRALQVLHHVQNADWPATRRALEGAAQALRHGCPRVVPLWTACLHAFGHDAETDGAAVSLLEALLVARGPGPSFSGGLLARAVEKAGVDVAPLTRLTAMEPALKPAFAARLRADAWSRRERDRVAARRLLRGAKRVFGKR